MRPYRVRRLRPGFTLIELLVIIFIITAIMGLGLGAYFRVRASQEVSAARTTVQKLQTTLDSQIRAVTDNAREDVGATNVGRVPAAIAAWGDGDHRRVRAIWMKVQMKYEFPENFHEALVWPATVGLPIKPSYRTALEAGGITGTPNLPATPREAQEQSAVMLYLALTQSRRGMMGFNPTEHVGPHAISKVGHFDVFVDSWGQSIGFVRWAFGANHTDLNLPPHVSLDKVGHPIDPQDPEKTFYTGTWATASASKLAFFNNVYRVNTGIIATQPLNLSPVVYSAGPDRVLGVDLTPANAMASLGQGTDDDNIYGYRLRSAGGQ